MPPPPPGAPPLEGRSLWRRSVGSVSGRGGGVSSGPTLPPQAPFCDPPPPSGRLGTRSSWFVSAAGGDASLLPARCRLLVLLNPHGGKGKALQLFWSHVQPRLAQAGISFTLMLTGECRPEGSRRGAVPAGRALTRGPPRLSLGRAPQPRSGAGAGAGAGALGCAGGHVWGRADVRGEASPERAGAGVVGGRCSPG